MKRKTDRQPVAESTINRRPEHGLTAREKQRAKELMDARLQGRKAGKRDYIAVAEAMSKEPRQIELAMTNARDPNPRSGRAVFNMDPADSNRFRRLALPGERSAREIAHRVLNDYERLKRLERAGVLGGT